MSATWEDPSTAELLWELARSARVVTFDQRGAGRSDPLTTDEPPPLEERVAEALSVLDAAEFDEADLLALHDGGPVALLATTAQPERFRSLILVNTAPRMAWAEDYSQGFDENTENWLVTELSERWGTGFSLPLWAPSFGDLPDGAERWARIEQAACSPGQAVRQTRQTFATDARHLLELVGVPSLVIQRRDDPSVPPGNGRYLADRLPGCTFVELPGADHMPFVGDSGSIVAAIRSFLGVSVAASTGERRLGAVVFTDIVGSTERLSDVGDIRWRELLDHHDAIASRIADDHGGRIVNTTGDGLLALFSGPADAIRFAMAVQRELAAIGLPVRAGVHAGEVVARGQDIAGIAVHAAARVAALAPAETIYVSRTVTDLVAGSGLSFEPAGDFELKGIPGTHSLFRVAGDGG
jgi:class 3 adenylate cyclase